MKKLIHLLEVKTPCHESWEKMTGNDEVRFCLQCSKNVHNLSAMSEKKAENLLKKNKENICVRYSKTSEGKLINTSPKLTQIKRQTVVTAGVLATALSLSTFAYSQGSPRFTCSSDKSQKKVEKNQTSASFSGNVTDVMGVSIAKTKITMQSLLSKTSFQTETDDDGHFEFNQLEPEIYEIQIERHGFEKLILKDVEIKAGVRLEKTFVLKGKVTHGEFLTADPEILTIETKPIENIQEKEILELPLNERTFTTMGLIPATCEDKEEKPKKTKKKKQKK